MHKLYSEPRVPKELSIPKKPRKKKTLDSSTKVKYQLLKETNKDSVNNFIDLYKEDPFKARVKFFHSKNKVSFYRLVSFEFGDTDFEISFFEVSFGISVTNKMYSSQKKLCSVIYKKGKFYYINKQTKLQTVRPLTYGYLLQFISESESIYGDTKARDSKVHAYFENRFHWIKMLSESSISKHVNFNIIKEKQLYGMKDINRHVMKVPNNIAELIINSKSFSDLNNRHGSGVKVWKEIIKILDGVENLTPDILNSHLFNDACNMARTLGRRVNCRWGLKRLKEEHDKWAMEITNIMLDCEVEYKLRVKAVYQAFADYSGYKLLKTNKDLLREGMLQHHCVGTYINKVDKGSCAIFHVEGYTLQVGLGTKTIREPVLDEVRPSFPVSRNVEIDELRNLQFRGKFNESAPEELVKEVEAKMRGFLDDGWFEKASKGYKDVIRDEYHPVVKPSDFLVEALPF